MSLIVAGKLGHSFSTPGFAGGFATIPIEPSLIGDSGSVPEVDVFGQVRGEQGQGLSLFAPVSETLPFNSFNNETFIFDEVKKGELQVSPILSTSLPHLQDQTFKQVVASNDLEAMQRFRDTGKARNLNQADLATLNNAILAAAQKQAVTKGVQILDPTKAVSENHPTNATFFSQLPGAVSQQTTETLKTVTSGAAQTIGFVGSEIIAKNLPLILLVGVALVMVTKFKGR